MKFKSPRFRFRLFRRPKLFNLFLCTVVVVYSLISWIFSPYAAPSSAIEQGEEAVSFNWREVLPELEPVWDQFKICSHGLQEAVPVSDMRRWYTCSISEVEKMKEGWRCMDEGGKHLDRILAHTINLNENVDLFEEYKEYETEGRGHGPGVDNPP
mmetsp:Transcript_31518/g.70919  ORF Transcript_31518/g.70919 Transcript_31518/m.70919 type:complete len:155 (-) Transcript_31518:827-1291(-)